MSTKLIDEDDDHVLIECDIERFTDRAVLIKTVDDEDVWLPLSQIIICDDDWRGFDTNVEIFIPHWLNEKNEIT